jgi:peptide/nickel transport system substrate-binding protein
VVEFGILGPVEVRVDGRPLRIGGPKLRALLALLLLRENEPVSRDRLIEGLWGEAPPPSAVHTLDDYVSRLRKALGEGRVSTRPPGYALRVEPGEFDLDRFEDLFERGSVQLAQGHASQAEETLRNALGLWRGSALADVLYEPVAALEAEQLEERRLLALEQRIDAGLALGRSAELIAELQTLVREYPFQERLLGQLMLALYRSGQQAKALELFRGTRQRFAKELGIDPGPQLRRLERQILEQDPSLDLPGVKSAPIQAKSIRSRRTLIAAGVAGAALAVTIVVGVIHAVRGTDAYPAAGASVRNELVGLNARSGRLAHRISLAGAPAAIASGNGSLWVVDADKNRVLRADPVSGEVVDRIPLSTQPGDIVVGGGAVWVASTIGGSVTRIDPGTDAVTQTIRLGVNPSALAFGDGQLWVGDQDDGALIRIDPETGIVRAPVSLGITPSAVAVGANAVWIASHDAGTVTEIDPRSSTAVATVPVGQGPTALAYGDGSVWVANELDGTVSRIDPQRAATVATIPTGSGPATLAFVSGKLWAANRFSGTVSRIDPRRGVGGAVDMTRNVGGDPTSLGRVGDTVWAGTRPRDTHRGGTLVLLTTRRLSSIDPQVDYEVPPAQYLGLASDGLVAYDQTGGPDGLQLVPDLALTVPVPTDDGRTYVFRIRSGIRYSNGRLLRASDFVRAMQRLFQLGSPGAGFFTALVGGRACHTGPARCRLAQGVVADDAARTVSFHLTTPDPDFLFKLAIGFEVPIPPGTPMHEVRSTPVPGTGPYKIAQVTRRQIRFVRNPVFHEWSHAAQPDGNPDEIDWRFGRTPAEEARAIIQGRADWTQDALPQMPVVGLRHAAEVHSNAFPTTMFVQINTHRTPFNDVRVRRALSYAIDRAAIVRMYGGALNATLTCQLIPPGIPGHRRYCPYTLDSQHNGRWTAPNLRRADALVAASGTRGARVKVWSVSDTGSPEPGVRYIAAVLRRLGFRADVRIISSERLARAPARFHWSIQLLPVGWGPDYPSASEFFSLFIACNGVWTWHLFCDPRLDREMERAEALRFTDLERSAELWARLDREVVDRAVVLPLVNLRIVDLVSKRVRGYQHSPVYHFLPAQVWLR